MTDRDWYSYEIQEECYATRRNRRGRIRQWILNAVGVLLMLASLTMLFATM